MDQYAKQALQECNSAEATPHRGGVDGRPFWNVKSTQFMFAPYLQFPKGPAGCSYRFTVKDQNGAVHTLHSADSAVSLAPVWGAMPEGFVKLTAEAVDAAGSLQVVGEREIYKCAPFPGRKSYPPKARSYRECARKAFRFVFEDSMVQHWLLHGVPDPDYAHNAYPCKMIDSIITAMVYYAELEPENAEYAIKLACRAADYLLSITPEGDHPLAGLPPTYSFEGLHGESVDKVAPAARRCLGTTMMIYPITAGRSLLTLAEATGEEKYFKASLRIGEYYKKTMLPCGSWYLVLDCETGEPKTENKCIEFKIIEFFHALHQKTGDEGWLEPAQAHFNYIVENCLKNYNWEGQFEDIRVSDHYNNLTHFGADAMIQHIAAHLAHDEAMVKEAEELMRFVEDQFVLWGKYPNWNGKTDIKPYYTPAGLEQYYCYSPIDGSTAVIMDTFLTMYQLKKDRLYLEKAMTLGDTITRRQVEETGMIPTFWTGVNCEYGHVNFWINCQIGTAFCMMKLAEATEAEGIE